MTSGAAGPSRFLFETFLLHELRAFLHYSDRDFPIAYWKAHDDAEVDFVIEGPEGLTAIEVKSATRWDPRWNHGLRRLRELQPKLVRAMVGVYAGERPMVLDDVRVLPWRDFLAQLWSGKLFP